APAHRPGGQGSPGQEPFSDGSWPMWRKRLLDWIGDKSRVTDEAYQAARLFFKGNADTSGELTAGYAKDALAWYFLSSRELIDVQDKNQLDAAWQRSERALKRALALDPNFARAHRNLAWAYLGRARGE